MSAAKWKAVGGGYVVDAATDVIVARAVSLKGSNLRKQADNDRLAQSRAESIAMLPDLVEALRGIAAKIDAASGTPHFTAAEHDALLATLAMAGL